MPVQSSRVWVAMKRGHTQELAQARFAKCPERHKHRRRHITQIVVVDRSMLHRAWEITTVLSRSVDGLSVATAFTILCMHASIYE